MCKYKNNNDKVDVEELRQSINSFDFSKISTS